METRHAPTFKPLLYTTTVRNPERFKDLMHILKQYDGMILSNEVIRSFECDLFTLGIYRPMKRPDSVSKKWSTTRTGEYSEYLLTKEEANEVYEMNDPNTNPSIKGHKEAGFDQGWPSRFDTQIKLMKVLGFVYYAMGEAIHFSELGNYLANSISIEIKDGECIRTIIAPEHEQAAFLQSLARQQRCNPFIRESNDNIPLILLLQVIKLLNANSKYNNCGISRKELPLLIFWKDNNAQALYERIVKLREERGKNPSDEAIIDICIDEIMEDFKKFKPRSIMEEYPDDFIRKMRLTGLISLRGGGRYIDINHIEDSKVEYILDKYSSYKKYTSERDYFDYMSSVDPHLFSIESKAITSSQSEELLNNWTKQYQWSSIKTELGILERKLTSTDHTLKFIPAPARLEFLAALAIKTQYPDVRVVPNYPCDDEGLPTSTAGGDQSDIVCIDNDRAILVEVTMSTGRMQTISEVWPIKRHLDNFNKRSSLAISYLVAPSIYTDSIDQIEFVKHKHNLTIHPFTITQFSERLETQTDLYFV